MIVQEFLDNLMNLDPRELEGFKELVVQDNGWETVIFIKNKETEAFPIFKNFKILETKNYNGIVVFKVSAF